MGLDILLFSNDELLVRLLREAASEAFSREFTLTVGDPNEAFDHKALCIWDFVPGETNFPQRIDRSEWRNHLFLLDWKHLGDLQTLLGVTNLKVLSKPLTRVALRTFLLGYGLRRSIGCNEPGESTLRSERDEMLQIVLQANRKLQEFHQERSNFLARSLHDFRSPLTAISGYCELLLDGTVEALTREQVEIVKRLQHSGRRLAIAIDTMLQFSIAGDGGAKLNLEQGDIRETIAQALEGLSPVIDGKRLSVTVDVEPSPEGLWFDKSRIEQTLANLIENACKFTTRGGTIAIKGYPFFWQRRHGYAPLHPCAPDRRTRQIKTINSFRVDIHDSGLMGNTERIFEEYTSYAGGRDRSGAGLSLAICRMIISYHGGHVWAESNSVGTVFSFVLPLQQSSTVITHQEDPPDELRLPHSARS